MSSIANELLEEILELEPSLQSKEKELILLIEKMLQSRPKAIIDEGFKKSLREELLHLAQSEYPERKTYFPVNIFLPIGISLGFASLFGLWIYNPNLLHKVETPSEIAFVPTIVQTGSQAF
jgi:hypothetical protein